MNFDQTSLNGLMQTLALPTPVRVLETLSEYRGYTAYFDPLHTADFAGGRGLSRFGNNGDRLIAMGAQRALAMAGIRLVKNPSAARLIIISGSGAMTDMWRTGLERLASLSCSYPNLPLIVLPSSFYFETTDFARLLSGRTAPAVLFCREQFSYDILTSLDLGEHVKVDCDHDMAFNLPGSKYVEQLRRTSLGVGSPSYVLIVERGDAEASTSFHQTPFGPSMKRFFPTVLKRPIKWALHTRLRATGERYLTPFGRDAVATAAREYAGHAGPRFFAADISLNGEFSFNRFSSLIAGAGLIVTTRLHVGILAALLGKPTLIQAAKGPYQKIRGIYEYSMSDMPHVQLI